MFNSRLIICHKKGKKDALFALKIKMLLADGLEIEFYSTSVFPSLKMAF